MPLEKGRDCRESRDDYSLVAPQRITCWAPGSKPKTG